MSQQTPKPNNWSWAQVASEASQIGFSIAVPLILPILGGRFLDSQLGTAPMFMLAGVLIGMLVSGFTFTHTMSGLLRLSNANKRTYTKQAESTNIVTDQPVGDQRLFDLAEPNENQPPVDARLRTFSPGEAPLPDELEEGDDPFQLPQPRSNRQTNNQG